MGPLVRCTVAIRTPADLWPKIAECQMAIRKKTMSDAVRWNTAAEMFLPLVTLGEQPWERVQRAAGAIRPVCMAHQQLHLRLEGLVGQPNPTQPRYVFLGVQGDVDRILALQRDLSRALAPLLSPSDKPYSPLVQLGRLKVESEQVRTALGRAVRMSQQESIGEWTATKVELLRADAGTTGVHYDVIESFPLPAVVQAM